MPTFPFRRSPGQDLRDLFAHDRLLAQSNDLGFTSLGPGEGAAEVRTGPGPETAVAYFGHYAGKAGFLIASGGGPVLTLEEYLAAQIASGTAGFVSQAVHNALAARVGAAEGVNDTQTGRLDAHASRIGAAENDISSLNSTKANQSTVTTLAGRVGASENAIGTLSDAVTTLGQLVLRIMNRSNTHQLDLESLGKPTRPPLTQG